MIRTLKLAWLTTTLISLSAQSFGRQNADAAPARPPMATAPQAPKPDSPPPGPKPDSPPPGPKPGAVNQAPNRRAMGMQPPKPPKPAWTEFKLDPKVTLLLDFTDSNPDPVISLFSRTSGITILKDPSFKSTITMISAKPVHLDEAFEIFNTVLNMQSFELQKRGNLMVVAHPMPPPSGPQPSPPQPVTKVYQLKNADATQVAKMVNDLYGQTAQQSNQGGMPPSMMGGPMMVSGPMNMGRPGMGGGDQKSTKISSDEYSNSVVVMALPNLQDEVKLLIDQLDKKNETPLESQIFKFKYIASDDAVQAIQDVLTANAPVGRGRGKGSGGGVNMPFYFYGPYQDTTAKAGEQHAISLRQTNSVIVSATAENMEIIRKLVAELDKDSNYAGTTYVIPLENSKATDVATLLNNAFTKPKTGDEGNFRYFFYDYASTNQQKQTDVTKDKDETGEVVNVRDITSKVNIIADPNTNSLIVVTMPSNLRLIKSVVERIDRMAEQVMIETVIVEANLDKTTKLGVEWSLLQGKVLGNDRVSATSSTDFAVQSGLAAPTTTPVAKGLQYTLSGPGYKAFLNTLQTDSRFKVLSTPRIFTSNNVKAEINVSQQVPYITSQQSAVAGGPSGSLISNYDFKNVGVVLTVTPRITSSGQVAMDVIQSADDLQGFTSFNAPIINHRQASTSVSVKDGDTIVLGGIIRSSINHTENKIPLLGDLPLVGNLFKSSNHEVNQTELVVLLTPHIVRDSVAAQILRKQETEKLSKDSQKVLEKEVQPPKR